MHQRRMKHSMNWFILFSYTEKNKRNRHMLQTHKTFHVRMMQGKVTKLI